jgi:ribonuclease HI
VHIYTDGSRTDGGNVGSAAHTPFNNIINRLSNRHSVYDAELHAIGLAMDWILDHFKLNPIILSYTILSDSLSAIQSIININYFYYSASFENIVKNILKANKNLILINIVWVPSHVGLPGNERADVLAREATSSPL